MTKNPASSEPQTIDLNLYRSMKMNDDARTTIAGVLRHELARRGLRQADLVRKTGLGKDRIHRIMNGSIKPNLMTVRPVAEALGLSPEALLTLLTPKKPKVFQLEASENGYFRLLIDHEISQQDIPSIMPLLIRVLGEPHSQRTDNGSQSKKTPKQ